MAVRYLPFSCRPGFRQEFDGTGDDAARSIIRFLGRSPAELKAERTSSGEVMLCRASGHGYDECLCVLEHIDLRVAQRALSSEMEDAA